MSSPKTPRPASRTRRFLRRLAQIILVGIVLLALALLIWLWDALANRFVRFPRQEAAWQTLRAQRQPVTENAGWREFRGILHSHSELSHDSEVPFDDILRVLKSANLDFIALSDHCAEGRADFSLQWRGLHDGKLFIPGYEMKQGYMPFGVHSQVVLSNQTDGATLAQQIVRHGGLLFFAHPEEPRDWDRPELTGMEIYNLHTDFKRQRNVLGHLLPNVLVNLGPYPDHLYYLQFRRPTEFLQRWDDLNRTRHITGIAANDCHQNVGYRGFYTTNHTLLIEDTSPDTLHEFQLNPLTRLLARLVFGPLTPNRKLFHVQLDPYERSARFVNTHVLAHELTEPAVLDALRHGRVFVGFDLIADSSGFRWFATSGSARAVMGEPLDVPAAASAQLHARSPLPCRFTVLKDGTPIAQREGRSADWPAKGPGKYRVEAELNVRGTWVPWVYANPIEVR